MVVVVQWALWLLGNDWNVKLEREEFGEIRKESAACGCIMVLELYYMLKCS